MSGWSDLSRNGILRQRAVELGFESCGGGGLPRTEKGRCSVCSVPVRTRKNHATAVPHISLKRDRS